jgi:hypothetical protein
VSALRRIHLLGGPDAVSLRVFDADTGKLVEGVVKIELLCVPDGGALVNITQACRLTGINLHAVDAGRPLIDLPDDSSADTIARGLVEDLQAIDLAVGKAMLEEPTHFAGLTPAEQKEPEELPLAAPITPAVPVQVIPSREPRRRRPREALQANLQANARAPRLDELSDLPASASHAVREILQPHVVPLPAGPTQRARRAPPPAPKPDEEVLSALPLEDDLTPAEKKEMAEMLARRAPTPIELPRAPWPFPSSEERRAAQPRQEKN